MTTIYFMINKFKKKLILLSMCCLTAICAMSQVDNGIKTNIDIDIDDKGAATCTYTNKYNASTWDFFQKTVGNNTSILKNQMIRNFPTYVLSEFDYKQDLDDRTNKISFKIAGFMDVDANGDWKADLEAKNPDINKLTDKDFLLTTEEGFTMKLHLPEGTSDAKVEKDSFGNAFLTFPADTSGPMGKIPLIGGILLIGAGGFFLYKNNKSSNTQLRTVYDDNKQRKAVKEAEVIEVITTPAEPKVITPPQQAPPPTPADTDDQKPIY